MFDPETCEIRVQCVVLREAPTRQEVIKCALARNSITSSVVETTYIDTLASIQAADMWYQERLLAGIRETSV
jgi:hypothetical protein